LAPAAVRLSELERFLRGRIEMAALEHFPLTDCHRLPFKRYGEVFRVQDDRLKGPPLHDPVRIYLHNRAKGEVVLRPLSGVVLSILYRKKLTVSLGFMKFADVIRDARGRTLAEFEYGDNWVFHGWVSPPNRHVVELIKLFDGPGYLDELVDKRSEREHDAFVQECSEE